MEKSTDSEGKWIVQKIKIVEKKDSKKDSEIKQIYWKKNIDSGKNRDSGRNIQNNIENNIQILEKCSGKMQ